MPIRGNNIKEIRFEPSGGNAAVIDGEYLGQDTSIEPDQLEEEMLPGNMRSAGKRQNITVVKKVPQRVAAFRKAWIADDNTTSDPSSAPGDWEELGAMEQEGSIEYEVQNGQDANFLVVFRSVRVMATFDILEISKKTALDAYEGDQCDFALERTDGTYKMFSNVTMNRVANFNPGPDRFQTVRVRLSSKRVRDINQIGSNISDSAFLSLNEMQKDLVYPPMEVTTLSGDTYTFDPVGFSVVPLEPFAEESLSGFQLTGSAYGTTESSFTTISPAL